jgi:hypothetical protein
VKKTAAGQAFRRENEVAQDTEFGSRTRRRPIERDYAAAKDAEVGNFQTTPSPAAN